MKRICLNNEAYTHCQKLNNSAKCSEIGPNYNYQAFYVKYVGLFEKGPRSENVLSVINQCVQSYKVIYDQVICCWGRSKNLQFNSIFFRDLKG